MALKIFEIDPTLQGVQGQIWDRINGYKWWKSELEKNEGGVDKFAEGYKIFGFNRNEDDDGFIYREWLPNAKQVFLVGEFNFWQNSMALTNEGFGRWVIHLPDQPDGEPRIPHMTQLKVRIECNDGQWIERVPAWVKLAWQDPNTNLFNGVFWEPPSLERYRFKHPRPAKPENLKIYEAHVGMSSSFPKVATYVDFAENVLPRIKRMGYNAVQLMAVAEHAHYGCFGYHVTSFFAPASRSGNPEELKQLVDTAHGLGIIVLMDLVHAHCSSNSLDGIAMMDGTDHCYTHGGAKGHHSDWDSKIFHVTKYEVLRFLLSNVRWWLEEFGFDGFRFDGITSMLYHSHGIGKGYTGGYHEYFGPDADIESHIYLMLANDLIHTIVPSAVTVGEDVSGMPTLCLPVSWGGFGFDYRLAMAIPDMFIKILKELPDDAWDMGWIVHTLTNRRWKEKCVAYVESHDQAIVGDKTIAFWLMDAEMYTGMSLVASPQPSMCVERGLCLHKMIRLLVLGLGGEGYLSFMGNEFGHPEWIDFPRPENGWSYQHCRRRWDLADEDHLRYKFFQAFDELMQAAENRFPWLSSSHQYVVIKNEGDKVVAFERGDLLFIFNFHPCQSFEGYQVGMQWNEPMRCILDTDEGRFGGQMRLEYGHANTFPPHGGVQSRPHSVKLYLPSRTAQVLVRDSLLKGGVNLAVDEAFLAHHSIPAATAVTLQLEGETKPRKFPASGPMHLTDAAGAEFALFGPDGTELKSKASLDGKYRCFFPGTYDICGIGYLSPRQEKAPEVKPSEDEHETKPQAEVKQQSKPEVKKQEVKKQEVKPTQQEAKPLEQPQAKKQEAKASEKQDQQPKQDIKLPERPSPPQEQGFFGLPQYPPARQQEPAKQPAPPIAPPDAASAPRPVEKQMQAPVPATQPPATAETMAAPVSAPEEAERSDPREMVRCYSGLHILGDDDVQQSEPLNPEASQPGTERDERLKQYEEMLAQMPSDYKTDFTQSYKTFGLHPGKKAGVWTFREWIPGARAVFLIGEFNGWDKSATPLTTSADSPDVWCCSITSPMSDNLTPKTKYKLYVQPENGDEYYPSPAWSAQYVFTEEMKILDPVVYPLMTSSGSKKHKRPAPAPAGAERIYECHLGLAARDGKDPSFSEAASSLLPRVARLGYTAVLVMGVQECKEYSSMGVQPLTLFATSRDLGKPEDFQTFVAKAHDLGLRVLMSVGHDGAASCSDGLGAQYFVPGVEGFHPQTGTRSFCYDEPQVLRYLLSNLCFWMQEFGVDGFRFQNVSSMLYTSKGFFVPEDPEEVEVYAATEGKVSRGAITYLMMANTLVHEVVPGAITIAEEFTGYPGLCEDIAKGGLGFDLRQVEKAPELFHQLVTSRQDEHWSINELVEAASAAKNNRPNDKVLGMMEAAEHCSIGRRPLKIAMLSWETLHTIAAGGVAPHVTELGAALHEAGHEVHIFTRSTQMHTWEHKVWGVNYHEVSFDTSSDFVQEINNMCGAFVGRVCHVEGHIGFFDLIHGHDWLVGPAVTQLKSMGKRCVFTMHSTETGRCGNVAYAGQSARIRDIEGHTCHAADRVIAVSGVLKQEVCSHYNVHGAKVEVIYNGIHAQGIANMEWQDDWSGNTKQDKGFGPMDPMFLFVGRLAVQKGPDLLIEAIPDILNCRGDAKFLIVGDGHMKAHLQSRVHQLGIGHAVHFAGSVKSGSAHLKALFKACDAVVVPSRNEPFGIVVLEAWAAGKPVVATTCGGPRDFVSADKEGYLVDPNPGSIAWGCRRICENFPHAHVMGQRAKEKALNAFSWSHIARQTLQVYYEQLCLHGAPHRRGRGMGCPLAAHLLGPHKDAMGVMTDSILTMRGLSYLKVLRLLTGTFGNDASLTWMGSEFGHISSADLPRAANGNAKCRIPYETADEKGLKYKHLEMFEMCLNHAEAAATWLSAAPQQATILVQDEDAKILAYSRSGCLFVFNFHPTASYTPYKIQVPSSAKLGPVLHLALSTDEVRFGGGASSSVKEVAPIQTASVSLSLSPRTGQVLVPPEVYSKLRADQDWGMQAVDDFVDQVVGA